ncbi:hypothetical protein P9G44_21230 [Bacillus paralicheniformis]|uniref:hypothetical protein n=1 Tax=Bacillus sp. FSL W7-1354 TaxID=2921597 RepID=UPI001E315767|nr:hypothetical protein [Bacillus paralicheniformis]MCJ8221033.1 hypothetical protein [Bacillus paralicheniformis]MEC2169423.1 hypothetical protein [Bacillus paralicheniformis]MEC2213199.1 hypothetical protein [Bacillus paralicheniformis]MED1176906.1 hypothetical protein [Bacillus paralicheniformis]
MIHLNTLFDPSRIVGLIKSHGIKPAIIQTIKGTSPIPIMTYLLSQIPIPNTNKQYASILKTAIIPQDNFLDLSVKEI